MSRVDTWTDPWRHWRPNSAVARENAVVDGFDLGRLTDHDFELVCKDIFEAILGVRLEVFAPGADAGIDLRYLAPGAHKKTVVQCKHWLGAGRPKLIKHYKDVEATKVHALSPDRYLIATSVPMTTSSKTILLSLLTPWLQTTGDILGRDELVAELRNHPDIVKRHLRLWLTSSAVLDALLSKRVHVRAAFFEQEIAETLKTYAPSPAFDEASKILEDHHVLVIAGIPGVGKTTLAHVVAATHRVEGYDLYEIANDIDDALRVWDDDVPQMFYYDDFLGQTSLRDTVATSEDSRLIQLIRRIAASPNKRLVLTTREYILAQARRESEKLTRSKDLELARFILDISRYKLATKAEILYNHLHFSRLPREHVAAFAAPDVYEPIIRHRNFNPRLVAMTFENAIQDEAAPSESVTRLMTNLESPDALWAHMFDNQMSEAEVGMVTTVYTFRASLDVDSLIEMWAATTGLSSGEAARTVKRGLAVLEGTLLRITAPRSAASGPRVELHNPSIRDFLRTRLSADSMLVRGILQDVQRFEQIATLLFVAQGYDGEQLMKHLVAAVTLIEQAVARTLPRELESPDEQLWFSGLWQAIELGIALQNEPILKRCEEALSGAWPDYCDDPSDLVALIKALRKAPERSPLRAHEEALTEWLIADVLNDRTDWEALRSAEGFLDDLGGPRANAALSTINDYLFEMARDAANDFLDNGRYPGLSTAQEMLDYLSQYSDPEEEFPGYGELRDSVDQAVEHQRDVQRDHGYSPSVADEQSTTGIAEMMGHLRDASPE